MQQQGLAKSKILVMAVAAGVCVANNYYNQPILSAIGHSFNAPDSQTGIISVLTQAGYGLGLFFITPLGDRVDRKKLVLVLQGLLALTAAAMAFATNITSVFIISLLLGIFSVSAQVLMPMAASLNPHNRGQSASIVFTGILTGILAGRVFSGYVSAWLGWRYVYGISAGMIMLIAFVFNYSLPNVQRQFSGNYLQLLQSTILQFKRFPLLRIAALLGALTFGIFCSFWTTLTFHLSKAPFNYPPDKIGMFGILAVVGAMVVPYFGKMADKGNLSRLRLRMTLVIIIGAVLLKVLPYALLSMVLAVVLLDVGVQVAQVTNIAIIYSLDATAHSRINTMYMTCYFIGGAVGTFIGVQCWKFGGWQTVTSQLIIWGVFAFLIAYTGFKKKRPTTPAINF
jgi:predicted MFS family arabinose efflux permease